jgi:uncharacterized protein (DUF849 family)
VRPRVLVKASLNGARAATDHPALPITPAELAREARASVDAGAAALHIHPRGAGGEESLAARDVAAAVDAIRRSCPGVPAGVTTGAWIEPDIGRRLDAVRAWATRTRPDFASVNFSEEGADDVATALLDIGVGVEAGTIDLVDAERLLASGLADRALRILVEPQDPDPAAAVETAAAVDRRLRRAGASGRVLHHGDGQATWAVIAAALDAGRDVRIGLEDTYQLPDGSPAGGNADLVAAVIRLARSRGVDLEPPARPDFLT